MDCLLIDPFRVGDGLIGRGPAIRVWKNLIRSRFCHSAVIEAANPVSGHRIVGFGIDVFVSRSFADAEISTPRPGLNDRILASLASPHPVVLSESEIRAANTNGGLDVAVLYGCWRQGLPGPEAISEVCTALATSFVELHRGYRINQLLTEVIGEEQQRQFEATHAWRIVKVFDTADGTPRGRALLTRNDALSVAASLVNGLFHYRDPVLGLRDPDQHLLLAALGGLTDEGLARKLGITVAAVKKRWVSLFERTIDSRPDLFPSLSIRNVPKRGRQKRHLILAYVRCRPEELRPFRNGSVRTPSGMADHRSVERPDS
jgi:hypothetical protein